MSTQPLESFYGFGQDLKTIYDMTYWEKLLFIHLLPTPIPSKQPLSYKLDHPFIICKHPQIEYLIHFNILLKLSIKLIITF